MKRNDIHHISIWAIAIISTLFVWWSAQFILASSFVTIDGLRSYSLFDDAMISMRYAWNFSHGHGLVWNAGEYIQGYTNLLMVMIMSLITFFFSKTMSVLVVQMLGIFIMLIIAGLSLGIGKTIFPDSNNIHDKVFGVVAFVCGLIYYPLVYWSLMGMETGLLSVFLLAGVFFALQYSRTSKLAFLFFFSGAGCLAFLTRNDSFIFFFILWVYLSVDKNVLRTNFSFR